MNDITLIIESMSDCKEANDCANIIFKMYQSYCLKNNFEMKSISVQSGLDGVGINQAKLSIHGENVTNLLKDEDGIHRIVRISPFDVQGRRHTSFVYVNVQLYEKGDEDAKIVRSYVFNPYTLVKDLNTKKETKDIESVLNGNIHF